MDIFPIQTKNLRLVPLNREEVLRQIETMTASEKTELSADWLAKFHASTATDPWVHGFSLVHRDSGLKVGNAGFKGPPNVDGMVEIAYGVVPDFQGLGYATEAATALADYAFGTGQVRRVRAHTLPGNNASQRVLTKCGFDHVGEVIDPEDGLVCCWEKPLQTAAQGIASTPLG